MYRTSISAFAVAAVLFGGAAGAENLPAGSVITLQGAATIVLPKPVEPPPVVVVPPPPSPVEPPPAVVPPPAVAYFGPGKTTLYCIDDDGDGYGTGPGCIGPDADDADASVNTAASFEAAYPSLDALLTKRGYSGFLRFWFVDYASGNDATCKAGTSAVAKAAPCATLNKFKFSIKAGDVVVFRGGKTPPGTSMAIGQKVAGTAANPIWFMQYPGEQFILDRTPVNGVNVGNGFDSYGFSYVVWDGIKVLGTKAQGAAWSLNFAQHVALRHVETDGHYSSIRGAEKLLDVTIEKSYLAGNTGTELVYLGSRAFPGQDVFFRHNIMFKTSGIYSGFPAMQFNGRVKNLVQEGNISFGSEQCFSWLQGVSYSVFRNNLCFGGDVGMLTIFDYPDRQTPDGACASDQICPYDQTNNLIEGNTLVRPRYTREGRPTLGGTILVVSNSSYSPNIDLGHNTYRNNVVVGWGQTPVVYYYPVSKFNNDTVKMKEWMSTSTWTNNLFYTPGATAASKLFSVGGTTYALADFEKFMGTAGGNMIADPKFVAYSEDNWSTPEKDNFHLQPGSPAIGSGAPSTLLEDIQGLPRTEPQTRGAYAH